MIIQGHILDIAKTLDTESVDLIVTSPPYYSKRNYGSEHQVWDGNKNCIHKFQSCNEKHLRGKPVSSTTVGNNNNPECSPLTLNTGAFCSLCGAWKGELGSEPTFQLFVKHLVDIFIELKRVLKSTGSLWVNLGDSYVSNGGFMRHYGYTDNMYKDERNRNLVEPMALSQTLPSKCLAMIPSRFAIEMCDRGCYILRNDIIWHKINGIPESVKDRFTNDFEHFFFFTKQSKGYYFKQILEPVKQISIERSFRSRKQNKYQGTNAAAGGGIGKNTPALTKHEIATMRLTGEYTDPLHKKLFHIQNGIACRNKRAVWSISTRGNRELHYAMYPTQLISPIIESCCIEGGVVFDPFIGAGSTAIEAIKQNKRYLGVELNPEFITIAEKRIAQIKYIQRKMF